MSKYRFWALANGLFLVIVGIGFPHAAFAKTESIEVEVTVTNTQGPFELKIDEGLILMPEDAERTDYQSLTVFGAKGKAISYVGKNADGSKYWLATVAGYQETTFTLLCYCINRGLDASTGLPLAPTGIVLDLDLDDVDQSSVWDTMERSYIEPLGAEILSQGSARSLNVDAALRMAVEDAVLNLWSNILPKLPKGSFEVEIQPDGEWARIRRARDKKLFGTVIYEVLKKSSNGETMVWIKADAYAYQNLKTSYRFD